jgi:hypothetical protein
MHTIFMKVKDIEDARIDFKTDRYGGVSEWEVKEPGFNHDTLTESETEAIDEAIRKHLEDYRE